MTLPPNVHDAEPIPAAAKDAIESLMQSGDLFRYTAPQDAPVALLEAEFAELLGSKYALAVSSCSAALFLSPFWIAVVWRCLRDRDFRALGWFSAAGAPAAILLALASAHAPTPAPALARAAPGPQDAAALQRALARHPRVAGTVGTKLAAATAERWLAQHGWTIESFEKTKSTGSSFHFRMMRLAM